MIVYSNTTKIMRLQFDEDGGVFDDGFKYSNGLTRHLGAWDPQLISQRCPIIRAHLYHHPGGP